MADKKTKVKENVPGPGLSPKFSYNNHYSAWVPEELKDLVWLATKYRTIIKMVPKTKTLDLYGRFSWSC